MIFCSADAAAAYLAAMIDGEGSVTRLTERSHARRAAVYNSDLDLIVACKAAADTLGIPCRRLGVKSNGIYTLAFGPKSFRALLDLPIQSKPKRERLIALLGSYKRIPVEIDAVRELHRQGVSAAEIGRQLDYTTDRVWRALYHHGELPGPIPRHYQPGYSTECKRRRGTNGSGHDEAPTA